MKRARVLGKILGRPQIFPQRQIGGGKNRSRGNIIYIILPYYNISISWPRDEWSSLGIPEENPSDI